MKGKEVKRKSRHSSPDSNRELSGELLCKLPKEYRIKCLHKKTWRHFGITYCLQCGEKWEDKREIPLKEKPCQGRET